MQIRNKVVSLEYINKQTKHNLMQSAIDLIKQHGDYQVTLSENRIKELTEKLNGNFLYNFSWKIEALYKAHYLKREWLGILDAYNTNIGKEQEVIAHHESYFTKHALSNSKLNCSTNPASNISQVWEHECDIEIAKFFIGLP